MRQNIIDEVSLDAAQYVSWQMVTWHEVATWFGQKLFGVVPQFDSAFSWEDNYSNLLGVVVAAKAIQHPYENFNDVMTVLLKEELQKLGSEPPEVARYATDQVKGKWYTKNHGLNMIMRNFSLGLKDGYVTPALVPGLFPLAKPVRYPVPNLALAKRYGFKVDLEITPRGGDWADRCLQAARRPKDSTIDPVTDLPVIMKTVEQQANQMGFQTAS